jgi:hypothetical protein
MKFISMLKIPILISLVVGTLVSGQDNFSTIQKDQETRPADQHPELVSDLSKVAKAKVFIAKPSYRMDELMKLDVGLLVHADTKFYFPEELNYRILIRNPRGQQILTKPLFIADRDRRFSEVQDGVLVDSIYLIIGCNGKGLSNFAKSLNQVDEDSSLSIFNHSLFGKPADSCVDVSSRGVIYIEVEVFNEHVVLSPGTKSLVGRVKSNVLKISIR